MATATGRKGGSYALTEYVYDLSRLVREHRRRQRHDVIGHSLGGAVSLVHAGTFPEQIAKLIVLDGVTVMPNANARPAHERITKWIAQLDKLGEREPRSLATIEDAAAQMRAVNPRLSPELTLHLAKPWRAAQRRRHATAGSSTPTSVPPRRIGCCRTSTCRCGGASPARRC